MSWFDINTALTRIRQFLSRWTTLISNLDRNVRPSSVFECFSYISVVQAYESCGFSVRRKGPTGEIFFKRSIRGFPDRYTHFVVSNFNQTFEIRQNQSYRNMNGIYFNLDVTVICGENALEKAILKADNIHTFCECKHYRAFYPSTCAYFIGLARIVMPRNILWKEPRVPNYHSYPPPSLLVSGSASSEVDEMVRLVMQRGYHVRFFSNISPYGGTLVLRDWLLRMV